MPLDSDGRSFPEYLLYSKSPNGREKVKRDWLALSKIKGAVFCIPCLLFSNELEKKSSSALCRKEGFNAATGKWRKLYDKLPEHERSGQHQHCYWKWRNMQQTLQGRGIDSQLQKKIQSQVEKNRALLERLLDVTLFLASRNLSFRGSSSTINDVHNGNFLGVLELISHYDPVMHDHLQKVKQSQEKGEKMQAHYLSWESQNEFIELCGQHVLNTILTERSESIYFSAICDATPDISHTEQNVLILRYVHNDKEAAEWKINERFIEFIDFAKKSGQEIAEMLLQVLQKHDIDIADCRGQGFDNGANMSRKVRGVQACISEKNSLATYSPCASHSLNLAGVHAVETCPEIATFFGCINRLYVLFSGSPERWAVLKEKTSSLHRLSETRWSARIEAIRPVAKHLPSIIASLDSIIESSKLSNEAMSEAKGLKSYFKSFTAIVLATFWVKVLQSFEERNLLLQSAGISLDTEAANINDLQKEMMFLRNEWNAILSEAKIVASQMDITLVFNYELNRQRKRKRFHDETANDVTSESAETTFRNTVYYVAMDSIISQLSSRFQSVRAICGDFAAILKFRSMSAEDINMSCAKLVSKYSQDLTNGLVSEVHHLNKIYCATFENNLRPLDLLNAIYQMKLQSIFGEICIAIRIFCTLPVTVAEGERAFSKLKIIKNDLRSTMCQDRLNNLAILSIECELAGKIDFKDIIQDFANKKAWRCVL
ncbi:zinc finger MYM-type protein 1 [Huso huso]|uniref:Zinc finger MYM-type protein 1 n=1 Tax=Huso huso TaxID=61971 RepID=A0ABR0Z8D9_HUSHU